MYKSFMDLVVNEDLVSGLLTALNQFTVVEFKQPIESIEMGGLRWVYITHKPTKLLFIAATTKDVNAEMLKARLNIIQHAFVEDYISDPNWRDSFTGNIEQFFPFKKVIDEYYTQWLTAESITNIAEFFDILGVFQQLFNNLQNVIENFFTDQKVKAYDRVEKMYNAFANHKYIQNDPELSKIVFSRESEFFNIISINPMNCDFLVVEQQIINLLKGVVDIIKSEIGHLNALNHLVEENIFDYVFNNLTLLTELNLDKFLLQLFISR